MPSPPRLKPTKISAGKITPPAAANTGNAAFLAEESAPLDTSRLISRPTSRKKIAIRPSLIQRISALESAQSPTPIVNGVDHNAAYESPAEEFAQIIAVIEASSSKMPPTAPAPMR